jgi:tetratricopeptide (TPR) repeat protein
MKGAPPQRPPLRLKRLGNNSAARLLLARALLAQGQTARAAREADVVLRRTPEFAVAHLVRGLVHAAESRPAPAVRSLEFAVRLDENLQEAWLCLAHQRRELAGLPEMAGKSRGLLEAALEAIDRAIALDETQAQSHLLCSELLAALERPAEAILACRAAILADPALDGAHHHLARLLHETGNLDGAVASATLARELNPRSAMHPMLLGDLHRARGDREAAVREYQTAIRVDPASAELRARLAALFLEMGWTTEAHMLLSWAVKTDPKNGESYAALSHLYSSLDRPAEAVEMLLAAVRLNPLLPDVVERADRLERALAGGAPRDRTGRRALAHLVRGIAYGAARRRDDAAEALRHALRLDPRLTEAEHLLRDLLASDHAS